MVGDVHGCFYTFRRLIEEHWNPEKEILVQLGDLIHKGPHSVKCLKFVWELKKEYPYQTYFLKGNHEFLFLKYYKQPSGKPELLEIRSQLRQSHIPVAEMANWLMQRPIKWETPYVHISHAGVSKNTTNPYEEENQNGVLFNRNALKNLGKVQVLGHMILDEAKPLYKTAEMAWYIDTGAWLNRCLTGIKLNYKGKYLGSHSVPTDIRDIRVGLI